MKTTLFSFSLLLAQVIAATGWGAEKLPRPRMMERSRTGEVVATGSLRAILERQRDGLTGHAEEIYADLGQSDWLTRAGKGGEFSWERGPYYARGLVSLAFALDDEGLKKNARKWVDAVLAYQTPNGDFGPRRYNWWANMLPLQYLTAWADATGDERIAPFLEKYFSFVREETKTHPYCQTGTWAVSRMGDQIASVLWLYEKTGDAKWLDFARELVYEGADWTGYYHEGGFGGACLSGKPGTPEGEIARTGYRCHIVNFMQGLKYPALRYLLGGEARDFDAYRAAFDPKGWAMLKCGRPDAMLNGTESLSDRSASSGTELCAMAERIISIPFVAEATGSATLGDDLEMVAYNSLPATIWPDCRGVRYYMLLNQPSCLDKALFFMDNGYYHQVTGAICPGPHAGYGCCRSNWHVAYPKFVEAMWMKKDGGLVAFAHGPSRFSTEIAGRRVVVEEVTDYPYSGEVKVRVVEGAGRFPIFVRVPGWTKLADAGSFRRFERDWKVGDEIALNFPMEVSVSFWGNNAVAIRRGPLLYSWPLETVTNEVKDYPIPFDKTGARVVGGIPGFPRYELTSPSAWNYVLCLDGKEPARSIGVRGVGRNLRLVVKARQSSYAGWGQMRSSYAPARAEDPPPSPMEASKCKGDFELELKPLGETQLRITLFPWTDVSHGY